MAKGKKEKQQYFTGHKLGVFEITVLGTVCGYFVGWRYRYGVDRNIRAGLYFPTAESAIAFRDNIENSRNAFPIEHRQIA